MLLDPNTQTSCPPWPCSLTLTRSRSRLPFRQRKSIDNLAWMLSPFPQQIQLSLLHCLGTIALKTLPVSSVTSPGTANASAIHSSEPRSTTSQTRARTGRARKHRLPLPLPQALRMSSNALAMQVFVPLPLIPFCHSCSMLTMIEMQTQGPLLI